MTPSLVGLLCAVALLVAATLVVAVAHLGRYGGRARFTSVRNCTAAGCTVLVQPLFPPPPSSPSAAAKRRGGRAAVFMPDISPKFSTYNASVALVARASAGEAVARVTTTRASSFTYCPGGHIVSWLAPVVDHVIVTVDDTPYRLVVPPDMATALWGRPDVKTSGLQDARPFELAPGVVGLACTAMRAQGASHERMALVTLELPSSSSSTYPPPPHADGDGANSRVLSPTAILLLGPADAHPQKNWMPHTYGRRVYWVKYVAPQTVVSLSLDDILGARGVAVLEPRVDLDAAPTPTPPTRFAWRGSTPLIDWVHGASLLSVVHRKASPWRPLYDHAFAVFDAVPPFNLRAISRALRLEVPGTKFTFVAGLARDPDAPAGDTYIVTLGADDCSVERAVVDGAAIRQLLAQGARTATLAIDIDAGHITCDALDAADLSARAPPHVDSESESDTDSTDTDGDADADADTSTDTDT